MSQMGKQETLKSIECAETELEVQRQVEREGLNRETEERRDVTEQYVQSDYEWVGGFD